VEKYYSPRPKESSATILDRYSVLCQRRLLNWSTWLAIQNVSPSSCCCSAALSSTGPYFSSVRQTSARYMRKSWKTRALIKKKELSSTRC